MPAPVPVILDADPGIDDAVALALAIRTPGLLLQGVATTYGNTSLHRATRNTRHLLRLAGASQIPVIPGAARPLVREARCDLGRHGPEGVGSATVEPAPPVTSSRVALLELLDRATDAVAVVALGPLTNLANALESDAALVRRKVRRIVCMAGNFGPPIAPGRWADFNAWCDPEALDHVLAAGMPLVAVPCNATAQVVADQRLTERWARASDSLAPWLAAALRPGDPAAAHVPRPLHDVVPVASLVAPEILTLAECRVAVDLDEGPRRGHTREHTGGWPVRVATRVDAQATLALLDAIA